MWIIVLRTAGKEHVVHVVHVLSDTFVTVKRMEFPLFVEVYSKFIKTTTRLKQQ